MEYLSAVETAKLLRAALKDAFPGIKFSVKSRGALDVSYVDGPPIAAVERVAKRYAGAYFDGMSDYQGSNFHTLDGKRIGLLSTFVFVKRELSEQAARTGIQAARDAGAWNADKLELMPRRFGGGFYIDAGDVSQVGAPDRGWKHAEAAVADWFDAGRPADQLEAVSMKEADRVKLIGDDGYPEQWAKAVSDHNRQAAA